MNSVLTSAQYRELAKPERHGRIPRASAIRRTVDGRVFASLKEAQRYRALRFREIAGEIRDLECQPKYAIEINGTHVCYVIPDFRYVTKTGRVIVEDVKSRHTQRDPVYRLKKKLVEAAHYISVMEVI